MESEAVDEEQGVSLSRIPTLLIIRGAAMMLVAVGLIGGLHAYLAHRLVDGFSPPEHVRLAGHVLFGLLFLSIPAGFAAGRRGKGALVTAMLWLSHLWIGLFGLLLVSTGAADLLRVLLQAVRGTPQPWDLPWAAAALGVGLGAALLGMVVARAPARIERHTVEIADLPESLRGLRIVQVSDIHIGQTLSGRFLRRMVEQVNALAPDIVAVTGDLVDGFVHATRDQVTSLSELRAPHGVYYVTGNHEYYYGGLAWAAEVERLGLTVLLNQHRVVERDGGQLVIAGVPDHDGGHFHPDHACDPQRALSGAPAGVPRVLLAHQPRSAALVKDERVDLQLSGHTHGGQIFPFNFLVRLQQPVVRGMAMVAGIRVYTHRGTGYWGPPIRVGAPPEIAELTLVPAPAR